MAFRDGKLYAFEGRRVVVARTWPDLRAWYKTPARPWRHTRRWADRLVGARLFAPGAAPPAAGPAQDAEGQAPAPAGFDTWLEGVLRAEHGALAAYFDAIPGAERREALRYADRRWHLLALFARCPGALELSASNPALAYALASSWVFRRPAVAKPMRAARSLVRRRQREVLGWLGFPPTEAARRILAKIPPPALSVPALLYLRDALGDPAVVKVLSHLPALNAGVLRLATSPRLRPLASPRLLLDLVGDPAQEARPEVFGSLCDTLALARRLGLPERTRPFASLAHLRRIHDDLARRAGGRDWARLRAGLPDRFPPPPWAGTAQVVPLRAPEDLRAEGEAMGHCVASLAPEVASGRAYLYRVLAPARATLSLRCRTPGDWRVEELRGYGNRAVGPEVRAAVAQWLDSVEEAC